jgi:hypothetical protein
LIHGNQLLAGNVFGYDPERRLENWGMLRRRVGERWKSFLAPSFDHASSLGRELADHGPGKTREQFLAEDRISNYAEKARGGIIGPRRIGGA